MSTLGQKLKQRHKTMKQERTLHEDIWDDNVKLFMPYRGDVTTKVTKGAQRIETVLDSTGMEAADGFVNFINGNLFGDRWVNLTFQYSDDVPDEIRDLGDRVAQATSRRILAALDASNFKSQAPEFLRDMAVLGTGIMRIREKKKKKRLGNSNSNFGGLNFKAVFPVAAFIAENEYGEVDTVFYKFEMKAYEVMEEYGRLPRKIAEQYEQNPEQKVELLFCVFPVLPESMPWTAEAGKGPFAGVTLFCATEADEEDVVDTTDFGYNPYVVGRWMQVEGEVWGRGPGHKARPDMKSLNAIERQKQIALGMDLRPPMLAPHDGIANVDILPGAIISVKTQPGAIQPQFMTSGSNFAEARNSTEEMRQRVKSAFLMDVIGEKDTEPRSAEESIRRDRRAFQRISGPTSRQSDEFVTPTVSAVIEVMLEADALPEFTEFMAATTEDEVTIELVYQSPLLVAQREGTVAPLLQTISEDFQAFTATQDPRWIDGWDPDGVKTIRREVRGLDARAFLPPEVVNAGRETRAQQAQAQNLLQSAEVAANVVNKVGGANVPTQ